MEKKEKYELLLRQVESLIAGETNKVGVLANVSAAIHEAMGFFWTGFYLVNDNELILGPFQGSVACYHIPYNKGVCGTAWARRQTVVVPDVEEFPGHIACSSLSRSEIVVPVFNASNEVVAVLDIDSKELSTFDEVDQYYLERIVQIVALSVYSE
ncbi:MAG: GAF domain-containing protein [Prevotella sp.]|nr:GAF domain-containing protein [Prevotella sp.]